MEEILLIDSENIAKLLENFKYDKSKTDMVLSKYSDLINEETIKSLKLKIR